VREIRVVVKLDKNKESTTVVMMKMWQIQRKNTNALFKN